MQRVIDFLNAHNAKTVAIFSHIRGDGDCFGAQTGLAEVLSSAGFTVVLFNQDQLAENFAFLSHFDTIAPAEEETPVCDVCIAVDCATLERIGKLPEAFLERPWINIDHHISNSQFGQLNIVDGEASSTCEIVSKMCLDAGISLSAQAATSFYTGISTDTGSFLYPSAHAETFRTAAALLDAGADKSLVQRYIFENTSRKQIAIYQYLYAHLTFAKEGALAYCVFSNETLADLNASSSDLEGVVSMIKEIQGVEVAVLFTESKKDHCKISLRSRDWFDCNRCCATLGGGGHVRASGAMVHKPLAEAVQQVLAAIDAGWAGDCHAK